MLKGRYKEDAFMSLLLNIIIFEDITITNNYDKKQNSSISYNEKLYTFYEERKVSIMNVLKK